MHNKHSDDTALHDLMVGYRHLFHQRPELGFEEHETAAKVAGTLRSFGLEVHEGVGVVGVLRNGNGNRAIAFRADMDALPILETSTHNHVSEKPGKMHACGHDGHMAMLLGAAKKLAGSRDFDGTIVFLFQPNEEHGLGAKAMLKDGVFNRFPVEEVYAIHNLPGAPLGEISTRVGIICSSESLFEIEIEGQGGHASMPQVGVDSILVGADVVQALQSIVARKLPPSAGAVVSVTEFITNGQRNVLPGRATLKGDVRTRDPKARAEVERFMRQITDGIAAAHGVKIRVDFRTEFIETINTAAPVEAVLKAASEVTDKIVPDRVPMSFSEDFAHFSKAVPGCFLLLGNGQDGAHGRPLHSSDYDFNDDVLLTGARFWATLAKQRLPLKDT